MKFKSDSRRNECRDGILFSGDPHQEERLRYWRRGRAAHAQEKEVSGSSAGVCTYPKRWTLPRRASTNVGAPTIMSLAKIWISWAREKRRRTGPAFEHQSGLCCTKE